jgi:N-carbamoylputrescine amidase
VKLLAAAIQMASEPLQVRDNLDHADVLLSQAHDAGATLAVLPEMFNTGYAVLPDFAPLAEPRDGPTLSHLARRSREWGMGIAAGFVERDGHDLYDSFALCTPDAPPVVYRKRHLVFWERFRFRPGRAPVVAVTRWGRIGFAVCADMIYRRIWDDYRGAIDLALIAAAWPDFQCRDTGRKHWLFGHIGPMSSAIPGLVAKDLGVPVVFANQCGPTRTTIPYLGMWITCRIADRFAGQSAICDGLHGSPILAGPDEHVLLSPLTLHSTRRPLSCRSTSRSAPAARSSAAATP